MALTILEGSTFCICDERGDIGERTSGFFTDDTRFLSRLVMNVNGESPLLLSSNKVDYFSAAFYLRNPINGLPQDTLSIARERFVGNAMQDRVSIKNEGMQRVAFEVSFSFASDFADIFAVKSHDFALGDPVHAALPQPVPCRFDEEHTQFIFEDTGGDGAPRTQVILSRGGSVDVARATIAYHVELDPRERWDVAIDVFPSIDGSGVSPPLPERRFGDELTRVRDSLAAWQMRVPQLRATWDDLQHAFEQSVADLAALRMRGEGGVGKLPAAGMPWFMTVFGRDTLITCLQTLVFGPELARTALHTLAALQAETDDPYIDAEPGKIVHEVRRGKAAGVWHPAYYGTVDATPLYLVLLSEVWRWTDDAALALELRDPALRALEWIDRHGDRDDDGFVEYHCRSANGLANQSWKDSADSQRFADGRTAAPPIAPVEVQGYVYDAKRRIAEMARAVWRDRALADRLDAEAEALSARFNAAFWAESNGGYYVLGLDGEKRQIDALTSNMGHLLWSGIVPAERADAVVDRLMGEGLWSGWGVRTMSRDERAYNPLSYHNGTVWPHDNSLIAWGLARYGRWPEAHRIVQRMMNAARHFDWQLPEVFAGLPRAETLFPIAYPTAARPQAWAAGTPALLLQILLGLQPDRNRHALESVAPAELPSWSGSIRLSAVRAFDRVWNVRLEDGKVRVEEE